MRLLVSMSTPIVFFSHTARHVNTHTISQFSKDLLFIDEILNYWCFWIFPPVQSRRRMVDLDQLRQIPRACAEVLRNWRVCSLLIGGSWKKCMSPVFHLSLITLPMIIRTTWHQRRNGPSTELRREGLTLLKRGCSGRRRRTLAAVEFIVEFSYLPTYIFLTLDSLL